MGRQGKPWRALRHGPEIQLAERCQFFYRRRQMYGTGIPEYDDLAECVVSLLQVQADRHAGQQDEPD